MLLWSANTTPTSTLPHGVKEKEVHFFLNLCFVLGTLDLGAEQSSPWIAAPLHSQLTFLCNEACWPTMTLHAGRGDRSIAMRATLEM